MCIMQLLIWKSNVHMHYTIHTLTYTTVYVYSLQYMYIVFIKAIFVLVTTDNNTTSGRVYNYLWI